MIAFFMRLKTQLKLYHWQTQSYARHTSVDELSDAIRDRIDAFVETYIGVHGRPLRFGKTEATVSLKVWSDDEMPIFLRESADHLMRMSLSSDLASIRDEIVAAIHRTLYQFTLL